MIYAPFFCFVCQYSPHLLRFSVIVSLQIRTEPQYLLVKAECNQNTTAKFLQFFKRIIIIARNNGWLHHDPFANYKIKVKSVDRGFLDKEEIAAIAQKEFISERLDQVRDLFLFSCFTDLSLVSNTLKTSTLQIVGYFGVS